MKDRPMVRRVLSGVLTVLTVGGLALTVAQVPMANARPSGTPQITSASQFCTRVVDKGDTSPPPSTCGNTLNRGTPDGYQRIGVKIDDYTWISKVETYQLYDPQSNVIYCEVDVQFEQKLDVLTPKYWDLKGSMYTTERNVPCVSPGWTADYLYSCGVNITGESDPSCTEYKNLYSPSNPNSPSPSAGGSYIPGNTQIKYFGFETGVTKFPLMKYGITFQTPQGPRYLDYKFRGYDVCVRTTGSKLCANSGTGA